MTGLAHAAGRGACVWAGAGRAAWAAGGGERELGLARVGPRGERVRGRTVGQVWVVCWVGFLVLGFLSISPFLVLIQTNTQLGEFKFEFEFTNSTQTIKLMHQHECNTNN